MSILSKILKEILKFDEMLPKKGSFGEKLSKIGCELLKKEGIR